ncbi:MAG TPA: mechanosensitive ion channel domain-containing protein [Thermomicrobiales bacterium]|jgi:small-conductance mechanosensitive channel|nr:mechanosensitive ion channel domain-containing protein [Thermomicrobiales bacterium]
MELFGIRLVGINVENGQKLILTLILVVALLLVRRVVVRAGLWLLRNYSARHSAFWFRQGLNLATGLLLVLGILSIWFDDPTRLATAVGLVAAGLAFAMQRVVTSLAGYLVILRGDNFTVGDRITMGGVRGDVIRLGFIQTTIMEMGQPSAVQSADPPVWVRSRQYTGRLVTVTNDSIFETPVYNYTREFPYVWEEMTIPIAFSADRKRAEQILLDAARRHGADHQEASRAALSELGRRYFIDTPDLEPTVYFRLTDNWLELTVRFLASIRSVRDVKDAMSREILEQFDEAGMGLASATYEIVGLPPLVVRQEGHRPSGSAGVASTD